MAKNILIMLLCVATLGSLGWGYYEHRQVQQVKQEQVRAESDRVRSEKTEAQLLKQQIEREQSTAEKAQKDYAATVKKLNAQIAELKTTGAKSVSTAAADGAPTTGSQALEAMKTKIGKLNALAGKGMPGSEGSEGGQGKPFMANIAKMMKNPEMRKMVQAQQKPVLEMTYGPLYDLLNLDEAQKGQLKDMLEQRQNKLLDLSFEMMDEELTPEQKTEKQKALTAMQEQSEKDIETLLGKENFTVYKTFEETQPERMTVQMFSQGLEKDLQLSEIQKNDLVFAMHKARTDFKFTTGLDDKNKMPDFNNLDPALIQKHMEESRQLNAKYLEAAGKYMNAIQLEKFRSSIESQQQMQELGLKMLIGEPKGKK